MFLVLAGLGCELGFEIGDALLVGGHVLILALVFEILRYMYLLQNAICEGKTSQTLLPHSLTTSLGLGLGDWEHGGANSLIDAFHGTRDALR